MFFCLLTLTIKILEKLRSSMSKQLEKNINMLVIGLSPKYQKQILAAARFYTAFGVKHADICTAGGAPAPRPPPLLYAKPALVIHLFHHTSVLYNIFTSPT